MFWNQMSIIEQIITIVSYCVFAWICLSTFLYLMTRKRLNGVKDTTEAYWRGYDRARADLSILQETLRIQRQSKK